MNLEALKAGDKELTPDDHDIEREKQTTKRIKEERVKERNGEPWDPEADSQDSESSSDSDDSEGKKKKKKDKDSDDDGDTPASDSKVNVKELSKSMANMKKEFGDNKGDKEERKFNKGTQYKRTKPAGIVFSDDWWTTIIQKKPEKT